MSQQNPVAGRRNSPARDRAGSAAVAAVARLGVGGRRAAPRLDDLLLLGPRRLRASARVPAGHGELGSAVRAEVYRELWSDAAGALGAHLTELGGDFLEIRRDGAVVRVRGQLTPIDDPVAMRLAGDKLVGLRLLRAAGLTVPASLPFSLDGLRPAYRWLEGGGAFVVKPAVGTAGGDGVSGGVRTPAELRRAAARAGAFGPQLLLERQVPGLLHRVLVLDGAVVDVVVDRPVHVRGDGRSTVEQLVAAENSRRMGAQGRAGLELVVPDLDLVLALRAGGLALDSVPRAGADVRVRTITNDRGPEDSHTHRGAVDDSVVEHATTAASVLGLRLAGVDLVAPRIDVPLSESGGVLLEVNAAPGLHRHHQVADPARATRVFEVVLERLLSEAAAARGGRQPTGAAGVRRPQWPAAGRRPRAAATPRH